MRIVHRTADHFRHAVFEPIGVQRKAAERAFFDFRDFVFRREIFADIPTAERLSERFARRGIFQRDRRAFHRVRGGVACVVRTVIDNVGYRVSDERFVCRDGYIFRYAFKARSIPSHRVAVHGFRFGDIRQIGKVKHFARYIRNAVLFERDRVRGAGNRHLYRVVCRELVVLVHGKGGGCDIFASFNHFAVIAYRQFHAVAVYKVGCLDGNRLLRVTVVF